jgi:hypothetical protein
MKSVINSKVTPEKKYPGLYTNTAGYIFLMPNSSTAILMFAPALQSGLLGTVQKGDMSSFTPFIGSITLFSGD